MKKPLEDHRGERNARTREPELVTCHFSGEEVPKSEAVLVRLAAGLKVWMLRRYCRDG